MKSILIDVTKCVGCMDCINACAEKEGGEATRTTRGDSGLSAAQLSTIICLDDGGYAKKGCMHCLEPNCVAACLVGAIRKTPDGPVVYDADSCIGCRYCMLACPFHIPRYEWESTAPRVRKCDMCAERIASGDAPVCVETCTHGALELGERAQMIEKAHSLLKEHPSRYADHVWGEAEWGGASVIYVASSSLAALGWPSPPDRAPLSSLTDPLIHATPAVGLSVLLGTWGLSAIIQRRNKLMGEKRSGSSEGSTEGRQEDSDAE